MKIKIIIGVFCLSLIGLVSCNKEGDNVKPMAEVSDAVKEYYGLKNEANSNQIERTASNKKSLKKGSKIPVANTFAVQGSSSCKEYEKVGNREKTTYLPCSMAEGYFEKVYYPETNVSAMEYNVCSIDENKPRHCVIMRMEAGDLDVDSQSQYESSYYKKTYEGKSDFIAIHDNVHTYSFEVFYIKTTVDGHIVRKLELSGYTNKYISKSSSLTRGEVSYTSNLTSEIIVKYKEVISDLFATRHFNEDGTEYKPSWYDEAGNKLTGEPVYSGPLRFKVQGIELVKYKRNGVSGEFTINYGNGELDTKAIITENGASCEVDYKELEEARWEEFQN